MIIRKTFFYSTLPLAFLFTGTFLLGACQKTESPATKEVEQVTQQKTSELHPVRDAADREVQVPLHPQSIAVLSEFDLDGAIALGITPIGSTYVRGQSQFQPYLSQYTAKVASLGTFGQPSMETLLGLQPDLIVAGGVIDQQLLSQLNSISPTAISFARGESWKTSFQRLGQILNKTTQADQILSDYETKAAQAKVALNDLQGQTVSVVRWTANGPVYMLKDSFASQVLHDIGLKRPEHQLQEGASHSPAISRERLDQIDADWLIIGTHLSTEQQLSELKKLPEFNRLNAVKKNQYFIVDAAMWTGIGGPFAANQAIDDVLKHITP